MLGPQTWGRHPDIYLPDLDSKPVCDLNILSSVQAEVAGEDGGQRPSLVIGGGGHELQEMSVTKSQPVFFIRIDVPPSAHLPEPPNQPPPQFSFLLCIL